MDREHSKTARVWVVMVALALGMSLASGCGDDGDDGGVPAEVGQTSDDAGGGGDDTGGNDAALDTGGGEDAGGGEDVGGDVEPDAPVEPPDPFIDPGPYQVAYQRHEVVYTPRGWDDQPRSLFAAVWYPTEATEGEWAKYAGLVLREGIVADGPPALDGPAPVLVFSHGSQSFAEQSWFLTEHFASHGWIVMAMEHPGNTLLDDSGSRGPYALVRPQDVIATMDYFDALPAAESLSGLFGDDRVMTGHSYGGYTTLAIAGATFDVDNLDQACQELDRSSCPLIEDAAPIFEEGFADDRIDVAVPMTPGGFLLFGDGLAAIDMPMLLITAAGDNTLPPEEEGEPIWAALDGPDQIRLDLLRGGHFTPSNMCEFLPNFAWEDGCSPDFLPYLEGFDILNGLTLAYVRMTLWGDAEAEAWFEEHLEVWSDELAVDAK